jgi:triacylglycerol lipase
VIRGTDNTDNVLSDIDIRMIKDDVLDIYLHKGFKDASTTIIQEVDKYYQLEHTVHVTGHSLGGAIAQIIGMWLHKRGHNVQVFSYGSPKVSSQVLVSGQPTHWRVVRLSDPVTFSPTYPYVHTGVFVNSQTLDWGPDNDNGLISKTDGLDHSISKYVTTLKEQL